MRIISAPLCFQGLPVHAPQNDISSDSKPRQPGTPRGAGPGTMGKPWGNNGETMGKPWENDGEMMVELDFMGFTLW